MSADADLFRTQTFFTQIHYSSPSSVSSVSSTTSFSRLLCLFIRCNDLIDLVGHIDTVFNGLIHHKSDIRSITQIDGT